MTTLLLASASPARLSTLRSAGINPLVAVSAVDEPAVLAAAAAEAVSSGRGELPADEQVLVLARAKARDVLGTAAEAARADLVLGCDSMLEIDDGTGAEVVGKPADAADAVARWRRMRGRSAELHTGHWLVRGGREVGATSSTVVHFADLSDAEIDAYVATGEPLRVAGAFTIDGLGGPFVTGIEGDHHGVVGLSLPLLRDLLGRLGLTVPDLWSGPLA
ncbi:Maf family nucleotide pyrophosphatase [Georgenia sp. EYE_87]|uniref:nucleoside triphosphate pyrophosphatase n=1 Tax=Georgenia sp. EYE_87 TaxID=2853448 RepID=UPI0020068BED|nr:nucleoside triphosphate pyrophosphatase [Georgenia sp. EYE_87]MCK6210924.1 Maf family nucleotide pyrophosphatase [Georgenia sp. EYE_87]